MLKFLFGGKTTTPEVVIEKDRARFERLVGELNELIDTLGVKPRVTFDPETGHILPETPEQFADEALALPAPVDVGAKQDASDEVVAATPEGDAINAAQVSPVTSPATPDVLVQKQP